jgi:hypothetical protein
LNQNYWNQDGLLLHQQRYHSKLDGSIIVLPAGSANLEIGKYQQENLVTSYFIKVF